MRRPSVRFLPEPWLAIAREVAQRLAGAGHRGWIVGGAVRDLALGLEPLDVDMASAAPPEEVERLFEHTTAVGKAFGTVIVRAHGREVQLTTFRSESGYSDARRPDEVRYGKSVEEDSERRDFTCNALYLDPLDDSVRDPQGGLEDLGARRLRCVGDPAQRFREDGLRLARMARLAAALDLEIDPRASDAARAQAQVLERISVERRLGELERMLEGRGSARALRLLVQLELLPRLIPGQDRLHPPDLEPTQAQATRLRALEHLGDSPGLAPGLALLLDPSPREPAAVPGDFEAASAVLDALRPSRALCAAVLELWRLQREAEFLFSEALASRARRILIVRSERWPSAERLLRAWRAANDRRAAPVDELAEFGAALPREELFPEPLVQPALLEELGIPRGPLWGEFLEEAELLQLDRRLRTEAEARDWLAERLAQVPQVGGKTRRRRHDKG
jgi:tRNA nucleotidyltransferase/poly(A) polymerase